MARNFLAELPTYIAGFREHIRLEHDVIVGFLGGDYQMTHGTGKAILLEVERRTGKSITTANLYSIVQVYRYAFRYLLGSETERMDLFGVLQKNLYRGHENRIFILRPTFGGLYAVVTDKYEFPPEELERLRGLGEGSRKRSHGVTRKRMENVSEFEADTEQDVPKDMHPENKPLSVSLYLLKPFKAIQEIFVAMQRELKRQVEESERLLAETDELKSVVEELSQERDNLREERDQLEEEVAQLRGRSYTQQTHIPSSNATSLADASSQAGVDFTWLPLTAKWQKHTSPVSMVYENRFYSDYRALLDNKEIGRVRQAIIVLSTNPSFGVHPLRTRRPSRKLTKKLKVPACWVSHAGFSTQILWLEEPTGIRILGIRIDS